MQAVAVRFNLHLGLPDEVKRLDLAILMAEQMQNMAPAPVPWSTNVEPLDVKLQYWTPERARAEFLQAFDYLYRGLS